MTVVMELPPSESFNNRVITEARYGMNLDFTFLDEPDRDLDFLTNASTTRPSANNEELILFASVNRLPVALVLLLIGGHQNGDRY